MANAATQFCDAVRNGRGMNTYQLYRLLSSRMRHSLVEFSELFPRWSAC